MDSVWRYFFSYSRRELSGDVTYVLWMFAILLIAAIFQKRVISSVLKNAMLFLLYFLGEY